jgi:predicted DsbA family dithiol-disulfide isomerase
MVRCDYFLDVLSQWCYIADRAVCKVLSISPSDLTIRYILVPMDEANLPDRAEQLRVYRRSRMITGVKTESWINDQPQSSWHANAVTLGATKLGAKFDDVRRCVAEAALLQGEPMGIESTVVDIVSKAFELDPRKLRDVSREEAVTHQLETNKTVFLQNGLNVRPSFILRNEIGDHIVLGGQYEYALLALAIQTLAADEKMYDVFEAT